MLKMDEPLLSPKRLFNGFRMWCYFVIVENGHPYFPMLWYVRWYRRKEARFKKLGY